MDTKAIRPTRATRSRSNNDENRAALGQKSTNPTAKGAAASKGATGGIKAGARRSVFADSTNVKGSAIGTEKPSKSEKTQKAISSKPAQRISGRNKQVSNGSTKQSTSAIQAAAPRRAAKRTSTFGESAPSPKRVISKISRDAIEEEEQVPAKQPRRSRSLDKSSTSVASSEVQEDEPSYSDEPIPSDRYLQDQILEDEDATEEEEEVSVDTTKKSVPEDEDVLFSDSDTEEAEVTEQTARSRLGDTTTGSRPVLAPTWTKKDRQELEELEGKFSDFDHEDENDICMLTEYNDEIFETYYKMENKYLPDPYYMERQHELKWPMRAILVDWLVQVHHRFGLLPETLFLCCNIIDRFLTVKPVSVNKLQLVGATALLIASKYEEVCYPSVAELVYMVDGGYDAQEILKAERYMLSMLKFELGSPGPMSFLRKISRADNYDLETRTLAKYLLEVSMMDERCVATPPSFLAAGAHCLARHMLKGEGWSEEHVYFSQYTSRQLGPLVHVLCEALEDPENHHAAVFEKYADRKYKRAAVFAQNWIAKHQMA